MPFADDLPADQQAFLDKIWSEAQDGSVSMYDIGQALGLDKDAARQMGEQLIGAGLLEIVSLSGSVALTQEGRQAADTGSAPAPAGGGAAEKTVDAAKTLGLSGISVTVQPMSADLRGQLQALTFDLALANQVGSGSSSAAAHFTALAGLLVEPSVSRGTIREALTGAALAMDISSLEAGLAHRLKDMLSRLWAEG